MAYLGKQLKRFQVIPIKHSLEVAMEVAAVPITTSNCKAPSFSPSRPSIPATAADKLRKSMGWLPL